MATIKDVAAQAGLSVTTVSRVLNNRGYISEETRQKVSDAMEVIGYHPNEMARMLSKQTSNIIGVILPHINHPYFSQLISALEDSASKRQYRILLFNSKDKKEKLFEYLDTCASNRVAGIVLCSGDVNMEAVKELGVPLVTIERYLEDGTASIECDNRMGGELAAKKLIEAGCKNILCIGGVTNNVMPADERAESFARICKEAGISYVIENTVQKQFHNLEYYEELEKLLCKNTEIDGIFASSDIIAAQCIQVCRKLGRNVPEDIKIVGFDDVNIAALTSPSISTIHQPVSEMAAMAVDIVIKSTEGFVVPKRTVLPVSFVEREST